MMELTYTFTVADLGAPGVAEANCEALTDAFERTAPRAGGAVGADLEQKTLGATFCAEGESLGQATDAAGRIFVGAIAAAGLPTTPLLSIEVEGAGDAEQLPDLVAA